MNKLAAPLLSFLLIISCGKTDTELLKLKAYDTSSVSEEYPFVKSGSSLVLHYFFEADEDENIADDEFAEDFFIQINPDGDSFDLSSDDLINLDHVYKQYCFCVFFNHTRIVTGSIQGNKKSNGDWRITGTLGVQLGFLSTVTEETEWYHVEEIELDGTFHQSKRPSE